MAVESLIAFGHNPGDVWKYTPRQLSAYTELAMRRRVAGNLELLHLHRLASQGDKKSVNEQSQGVATGRVSMGTMTFSIASPAGSRQKVFTFPDASSTAIINAARNLYPAATAADSLDLWFADSHAPDDRSGACEPKECRIGYAAAAGVADIPIT
jgi:hypothetical protein